MKYAEQVLGSAFSTLTNVNFDDAKAMKYIEKSQLYLDELKQNQYV